MKIELRILHIFLNYWAIWWSVFQLPVWIIVTVFLTKFESVFAQHTRNKAYSANST